VQQSQQATTHLSWTQWSRHCTQNGEGNC
jgi:hypothetical protein